MGGDEARDTGMDMLLNGDGSVVVALVIGPP